MKTATVTLFGEELELVRPKGMLGLKLLPKIQHVYGKFLKKLADTRLADAGSSAGVIDGKTVGKTQIQLMGDMFEVFGLLFEDDDMAEVVIPALYMFSTKKMTKKQALNHIETLEITVQGTAGVVDAISTAIGFWSSSEDQEALEEALKKSKDEESTTAEENGEKQAT